jgi:hypothetical protein
VKLVSGIFVAAILLAKRQVTRGVTGWASRKYGEYWQALHGQRQAKGFLKRFSAKRDGSLLNLSSNHLRIIKGLLTGHCHLKGH